MARQYDGMMLRQVRTLFNLGVIGDLTDGQLLERFATSGGEATELAFAALVERHGPMVLRICRNNLRDSNDVEDAFQATFLVLVQRARSLWVEDSLAPWMHRVARRIAVRARSNAARRRDCERRAAETRPTLISGDRDDDGLMALLHEEIDRLPEPCRVPVVLCDLEGLTHEQAARHLSWAVGTVKSRLTRGRERLRARLVRRGVAPTVALLKMAMPAPSASAAVPAGLVEATVRAACRIAAGAGATTAGAVPATVALLMEGAFHTMFSTRIQLVLVACGLIAGGAVVAAQQVGQTPEPVTPRPAIARVATVVAPKSDEPEDDDPALAQEMADIELTLMQDEVSQLREQVNTALKARIQLEMRSSRGVRIPIEDVNVARDAYELARKAYMEKARELASRRHRINKAAAAAREDHKTSADATPGTDPGKDREADGSGTHASAAAIGSIDIDAVFKKYAKFDKLDKQLRAEIEVEQGRLTKLRADAEELASRMQRLAPGSQAYLDAEEKLSTVRKRYGRDAEELQQEFTRRKARQSAALLGEFREVTASVARAKGFDYVVESEARLAPDADEMQVVAAWKRSVLYANPRNDITEEVIRELNRRYEAAGDKAK
jgi:RNA polymerase sigma factor (sigma-70 family)